MCNLVHMQTMCGIYIMIDIQMLIVTKYRHCSLSVIIYAAPCCAMARTAKWVAGTTFSVLILEQENYNGEAMLNNEFRWTSRHKKDHPSHLPPSKAINYLVELVDQAITTKASKVLAYLELPFIVSRSKSTRDLYSMHIQINDMRSLV